MDGTPNGGMADDAPTAPQPPLTPEVLAAMAAGAGSAHHHERTGHAHAAPGGVAPHPEPHHAAPLPAAAAPSSGRRRALLAVGATVAALAVAGGAMAFAAGRTEPQAPAVAGGATSTTASGGTALAAAPPAASEAPGVTATAPMLPASQDTLVLGDSLGLTVYPWLADLLPDRYVSYEAEVGRSTPATYQALRALGSIPPVVLVSSGTNDYAADAFQQDATRILDLLGPDRCVVWVDVVRPDRDWSPAADMNAALDRAVEGRSNVSVLRWSQLVEENPGWLGGDGIHPGRDGAEGRARAMAAASLSCSPLDPGAPRARKQYVDPTAFTGPINPGAGTGTVGAAPPVATSTRTAAPSANPSPSRSSSSATASSSESTSGSSSSSAPPATTSAPPPPTTSSAPPPPPPSSEPPAPSSSTS